ncbi:hypothetical protein DPMN_093056 [Dreissena polymorpha]|uniref:Uncharacterized protein n=1 Tax=Dreissena polymorpha TaxID=45954 RepID=A0A9D4L4T6_DREPO|nr:hypothetical protein DPMN_093056 [Dreissena polymorpha]
MRPQRGPMQPTNPPASVKQLATACVRLLDSAIPLALRYHMALGEASVTALCDVRILQYSENPLTIQQELRSLGSTVRSQRKHLNDSEHCSFYRSLHTSYGRSAESIIGVIGVHISFEAFIIFEGNTAMIALALRCSCVFCLLSAAIAKRPQGRRGSALTFILYKVVFVRSGVPSL